MADSTTTPMAEDDGPVTLSSSNVGSEHVEAAAASSESQNTLEDGELLNEGGDHSESQPEADDIASVASTAPMDDSTELLPDAPTLVEQAALFREYDTGDKKIDLKEGDQWYVIDSKWLQKWQEYVGYETDGQSSNEPPGPIDNTALLADANNAAVMKQFSREYEDYMLISEPQWQLLVSWYGGGPAIARDVVRVGLMRSLRVDVMLLTIELLRSSAPKESVWLSISKYAKIKLLRERGCRLLGVAENDVQLWDYHQRKKAALLADMSDTLYDKNIINKQAVLFEERGADGKFPRVVNARDFRESVGAVPGLCGLGNLGNTCFMNSSLQCLSATAPLRRFFLTGAYETDVNIDNPLGCNGELASVFYDLLTALWSGRYGSVAPRDFKHRLERFAQQFAGYQQHDSQELLSFLLDGLHEDLNRVTKKPYVEQVEGDGRPDDEVAAEAWEGHRQRNDSMVVDHFHGQLRSVVECNECDRAVTTRQIPVTLVSRNPSTPTRYRIVVEKTASVGELKDALEALSGVAANSLTFADVYMSKIHRRYEDYEPVSTITSRDDIYAYEVLPPAQPSKKKQRVTDSDDEHEQNAAVDDVADEDVASTDGVPATSPAHSHDGEMPDADEDVAAAAAALALGPSSDTNNNNTNDNDSDNDNDGNDGNFYLALQRKPESTAYSFVGLPQILSFEHTPTYAELITSVYQCIKPFLGPPRAARPDRPPPPVPSTAEAPANDDNNDGDEVAPADTTAENDSDETALNQAMNGGASSMHTDDDDNNNNNSSSNAPPTNNANVTEADNTTPDNTTTATATATTATTDEPDATPEPDETETVDNEQKTVDTEQEAEDTTWSEGLSEEVVAAARDIQLWVSISAYREAQLRASSGPVNLDSRTTVTLVLVGALADRFNRELEDARVDDASFSAESDTAVELPTLDDCLDLFVKREQLGEDNLWYCSKCQKHQRAFKKFDIYRYPRILVVHLKRFSYSGMSRFLSRGKLETNVQFPIDSLDLSSHVIGSGNAPPIYQLYAISNHFGGMGGGHYIAHATHEQSKKPSEAAWYRFDDSSVSPVNVSDLQSSSAYVLFYRRVDSLASDENELEQQEKTPPPAPASPVHDDNNDDDDNGVDTGTAHAGSDDDDDDDDNAAARPPSVVPEQPTDLEAEAATASTADALPTSSTPSAPPAAVTTSNQDNSWICGTCSIPVPPYSKFHCVSCGAPRRKAL